MKLFSLSIPTIACTITSILLGTAQIKAANPPAPAPTTGTTAPVQADPFDDPVIIKIQERHEKGVQGDKEAVISLVSDLERMTKEQPGNYLLQAYLGSAYTMRSRDVFPGPSKLEFLKTGVKTMDAAVVAAPKDVAVRFIRAVNNYALPAFCGRKESARNDFKILISQVVGEGAPKLNVQTVQAIHYFAGLAYLQTKQKSDAKTIWTKGIELAPNTDLASKMQTQLGKLKS
ncbi:MAG: hypothetical protein ACAI35_17505 [Candidatus Methylacidiphilales bacterium]